MKKHVSLKIKYRKKYSTAQMYKKKENLSGLFIWLPAQYVVAVYSL